jgi:hypothetical protein
LATIVLQSRAEAYIETVDQGEGKSLDFIGRGMLELLNDGRIGFVKKKFLGLGNYENEPDHWYNLSNIVKVKGYSDGFDVEVYFAATEKQPAEVDTYFYKVKNDTDRWLEALSKRKPEPKAEETAPTPQVTREVIKEKEIIREIVKIRCRHCGELFEEKLNRCPHCGAPA